MGARTESGGFGPSGRILIADEDAGVRDLVRRITEQAGFSCLVANGASDAVRLAAELAPDLAILGVDMAGPCGSDALRALRSDASTRMIPVIVLVDELAPSSMHLLAAADDYIKKPFTADELAARLHVVLRRARAVADVSPITGLPGNASILTEVGRRLDHSERFAYLCIDIDNFKSYNDAFGFAAGDEVITITGETICDAIQRVAPARSFVGHRGGDDFVVIADPDAAEPLVRMILREFDARVPSLYPPAVFERGYVEVRDRQGAVQTQPLMWLSIGVTGTDSKAFTSAVDVTDVAEEMMHVARQTHGSTWAVDRRGSASVVVS